MKNKIIAIATFSGLILAFFVGVFWNELQHKKQSDQYPNIIFCDEQGRPAKEMHYTWDMNEDGINDCEDDGSCDDMEDYSLPRYEIPGVEDGIVFDSRSHKWVDIYGICHTCTPENGFKLDGTIDESMSENDNWIETIGTITESAKMNDGSFAYTLEYNVVGGDAKNIDGEQIRGALPQHIFGLDKQAVEGQKVKLQYSKDEPMFYELLEEIKFIQ